MRLITKTIFLMLAIALGVGIALLRRSAEQVRLPVAAPTTRAASLRIGLIPERDLLEQNKRYRALADYLSQRLGTETTIVTARKYDQVIDDLKRGEIDAAFMGSFVAVLAADRLRAEVIAKPVLPDGTSTYHGVIFVRDDSPARQLQDLRRSSVAIVRSTTGGNLFLISEMARHGMFSDSGNTPGLVWVGTHDDVIGEVLAGRADAGSVKNLRLDAYLAAHPEARIRRLAESDSVPENALMIRPTLPPDLKTHLKSALFAMADDADGRVALKHFGATRFIPCRLSEYAVIFDMIDALQGRWNLVGFEGPPPRRSILIDATQASVPKDGGH